MIDNCFESKKQEMINYIANKKEAFYSRHDYDYQQNIYFLENSITVINKDVQKVLILIKCCMLIK